MKKDRRETLFVVTAPGLEEVCAGELGALGLAGTRVLRGGVEAVGGLRELYLANLHLRTASRVLVRLGGFRCRAFPELFRLARQLPWGRFLRPGTPLQVRAASRGSRLFHTERIAATVAAAADRALGQAAADASGAVQTVLVRIEDDLCQVSVDASGELLHRRGYRQQTGPAPLRETLAAGLLQLADWDGSEALVDPLCGSGTIPVEAALLALRRAPGRERRFAFMDWPGYRPGLWSALLLEARQAERPVGCTIFGSDRDPAAIDLARHAARRAGVAGDLDLAVGELDRVHLPPGPGLVLCNPPYGERLGRRRDLAALYAALGDLLRRGGPGWRGAVLAPEEAPVAAAGLPATPLARLENGGLPVVLRSLAGIRG